MNLTIEQALAQAIEAHKSGNLQDAERLYREILRVQQNHPDANHNLGVLAVLVGKPLEGLSYLKDALETNPNHWQFWISYIHALIEAKQLPEAGQVLAEGKRVGLSGEPVNQIEKHLADQLKKSQPNQQPSQQQISELLDSYNAGNFKLVETQAKTLTQKFPNHPLGWKALGAVLKLDGRLEDSLEPMAQSLKLAPSDATAHSNLGVALYDLGRLTEAEASYREAIRLNPHYAEAHSNLGNALNALGRLMEAEASYREAIRLKPDFSEAHNNLGNTLIDLGRPTEAEASFREAIRLKPEFAGAHITLGNLLKRLNRLNQAKTSYLEAIRLKPNYAEAHSNLGVTLKDLGRLTEAEKSCREAIRLSPHYAEAHSNLGVTLYDLGRLTEAEESYREAIRLKPHYAEAHSNLGMALYDLGRLMEAEASYREAIRLKPDLAEAHCNRGVTLNELGRLEEAEASCREAIRLKPDYAKAHSNLGMTLSDFGRLTEAEASCREAIRLKPMLAEAHSNLGVILRDLSRPTEAEASCREAIRLKSDYAKAHNNLGNTLIDLSRPTEAEASYREAIRLNPHYAEAYSNLGASLYDLGRLTEAEASYREAIRLTPNYAEVHSNLGNTLIDLGRPMEAEASYRKAIRLNPHYAEAHSNLGNTLNDLGRLTEAEASFREAIRLKPDFAEAHNNLGNALNSLSRLVEAGASYREAICLNPDFAEAHSNLLFNMNYIESLSPQEALMEAKLYGSMVSAKAEPKLTSWLINSESPKLRLGFVSGDLRNHPVGYFVEGLIKNLDQSRFEIYAFTTTPKSDDLTNRIKPNFHEWIPIYGKSDHEAAKVIHTHGIQVLIDLSGHTAHNRLPIFSYKPAPVQISWLGYFATTGLPEIDYFLGDPYMSPECEKNHFTEKVWNLPETWLCLTPPNQPISINPLPALTNGYLTFGCFGNLSKMNDQVVKTWATILQRIPDAKLFLKSKQLADAKIIADVKKRFSTQDIPAERLILEGPSSRTAYFESYNRIDVVLDTFPYPGGTTSVDALWMGIPVLTLMGDRFLSHLGESIATNAGQTSWVAKNCDDYVNKAIAITSDIRALENNRLTLRDHVLQTPLFNTQRFAKNFGDALWNMWREHTKNLQ